MNRIIKDYKSVDKELLMCINSLYPDGISEEDLITFTNSRSETIKAIEIKTNDTIYLIKMSTQLEQKLEEFVIEEAKIDEELEDFFEVKEDDEEQ